ncbi:unnamed protein product [Allacma fusca]|uniref:Uncharacterized protein n=1 Tax=Allacma fusca TaxID=39272 RepID=A0A8J2K4N2_9HEXA|nr:unnamed protein product [Allacma fusca]
MLLKRTGSFYGRLVAKPEKTENPEVVLEENVTLQDQIENLRAKISLKERYNKVQSEEVEECRVGVSTLTNDLWTETNKLRNQLAHALDLEKQAVRNALRSHRSFQLALSGKIPDFAIAWLEDKVFDMSKRLNLLLDALACKRMKLKDSEDLVKLIENSPRPGTLKWEADSIKTCKTLEYAIENMRVKFESAQILHSKYREIRNILQDEKSYYAPSLRQLENQLNTQTRELDQLKTMLNEAAVFQNEALKNLAITEKEASENRRRRRRLMARMKKAVQKVLEVNLEKSTMAIINANQKKPFKYEHKYSTVADNLELGDTVVALRMKKLEIEKFQEKAKRLVESMRVPNLTYIPKRYQQVQHLAQQLNSEKRQKEETRDFLIRQRDHLLLIHSYLAYTGQKAEAEFKSSEAALQATNKDLKGDIDLTKKTIHHYGEIIVDVQLGLLSLNELLDGGAVKKKRPSNALSTGELIKLASMKITKLVNDINQLEIEIGEDSRFSLPAVEYDQMKVTRTTAVPPRLIRVGTPEKQDESDEEDYADLKVPTREDIKIKSAKIVSTGRMRRGLEHI